MVGTRGSSLKRHDVATSADRAHWLARSGSKVLQRPTTLVSLPAAATEIVWSSHRRSIVLFVGHYTSTLGCKMQNLVVVFDLEHTQVDIEEVFVSSSWGRKRLVLGSILSMHLHLGRCRGALKMAQVDTDPRRNLKIHGPDSDLRRI